MKFTSSAITRKLEYSNTFQTKFGLFITVKGNTSPKKHSFFGHCPNYFRHFHKSQISPNSNVYQPEVEFVHPVSPGGSVKFVASGVSFSIFTNFLCFFLLKLLKLGEIGGVKFLT